MTTDTRICRKPDDLFKVAHELTGLTGEWPVRVGWSVGEEDRTKAQNRTIHRWFKMISVKTGDLFEDVKVECNLTYGVPILRRDDEAWDSVFGYLFDALSYEAKLKALKLLAIPVTSRMKVGQLREYMDGMVRDYAGRNIHLTVSEDT